ERRDGETCSTSPDPSLRDLPYSARGTHTQACCLYGDHTYSVYELSVEHKPEQARRRQTEHVQHARLYRERSGGGNFLRDVALLLEPHGIAPPDCSGGEDGGVDTGAWQLAEASLADPVVFSGHPQDSRIAREVTLGQRRHHAARRRNDHLEADLADRDDAACPVVLNEAPRLRELHDDVRSEATPHKAT